MARKRYESPLWSALSQAKQRCRNPNEQSYKNYGARGIKFHWDSVKEAELWILENLGPRPEGMSLDRIDNNGNYEPGNLRWATRLQQKANRRGHCPTCTCEAT